MDRFEAIYKRRSVRKYSEKKLSSTVLNEIEEKIKNIDKLYKNIDSKIVLAEDGETIQKTFSGLKSKIARVDAPHYLIGVSEDKEGYLENMGFMLEDAVLYLTEKDIGTCWLGSGIEHDQLKDLFDYEGDTVILAAFGDSVPDKNNFRKNPRSASRKDLDDLIINKEDVPKKVKEIIDVARMAPSALNGQPWRFFYEDDQIHVYIEKKGMFKKLVRKVGDLEKLNHIDVGIALKHLEIGAQHHSNKIKFIDRGRRRKGYEYITSAQLE
ncbi:MAG: nitroreductase family protein [Candidatus Natronoplasma sp.]